MTLIEAQDRYVHRVTNCHAGHVGRVRRSAWRQLFQWAAARDFDAKVVCQDASDMAKLWQACDE